MTPQPLKELFRGGTGQGALNLTQQEFGNRHPRQGRPRLEPPVEVVRHVSDLHHHSHAQSLLACVAHFNLSPDGSDCIPDGSGCGTEGLDRRTNSSGGSSNGSDGGTNASGSRTNGSSGSADALGGSANGSSSHTNGSGSHTNGSGSGMDG